MPATQPGAPTAVSARQETRSEMIDRHMKEVRAKQPGITQTLVNVYGLSPADLNGFAADFNCGLLDDAREVLEKALARQSKRIAS